MTSCWWLLTVLYLLVAYIGGPADALVISSRIGSLLRRNAAQGTTMARAPLYSTVISPPKVDKGKTKKSTRGEPAIPDFLFKETRDVQKEFEEYIGENQYILVLYNDPVNKRLYVQRALMEVLSFTEAVAEDVMLQAHNYGFAVAGEFSKDVAIDYAKRLVEMGLIAEAKPANDDDESA